MLSVWAADHIFCCSTLGVREKIGGYHMITISDDLGYHINSTDTLDKVGKEAIGLKGYLSKNSLVMLQRGARLGQNSKNITRHFLEPDSFIRSSILSNQAFYSLCDLWGFVEHSK